ncbi:MAG: hypothetical protein A2233_00285 [Candidatus Kerfeldbacteria bacterium RIFOXYA2_FULL_38_24]|uniref:Rod shape-determining protein MreD n=1 Tax=Candidatus Kerfeldbacteria bacterium RIFOXYB2_FULL_38_14 TaxID=1798547 RepID=A0A1G2BA04_9BACT|nr:MAG: hypothetical protein A2233_00285 [Candidatus Kerfeldbacteria bacterium RIFOXYA2_FULL_38_24]OGY86033.1 MAG: hypothetical protein A2319_00490 [Candidatus Kerfeldbacteria bacterium RIFOXYB2_FULL_38_14]OGY90149.1 MAG: hypothetical protein A2458_04740 [Candidatus Kerfeldbacteria bacterium RIFOXYC2_FULL_38_9]
MKKYFYYFILILVIFLIFLLQSSVLISGNFAHNLILLPLIVGFIFAFEKKTKTAIFFVVFSGYLLDLISFLPFGVITFSYLSAILIYLFFQTKFFKNKALHAILINSAVAMVGYELIFIGTTYLLKSLNFIVLTSFNLKTYFIFSLEQILFQILLIGVVFWLLRFLQNRLSFRANNL